MNIADLLAFRLHNQQIIHTRFSSPEEVVAWLGAVQAQDYTAAKWALGLRLERIDDNNVEEAFNQGKILRTHIMRPTWHFVSPKDIRWLLRLTKDRVHGINGYYYRQLGLDDSIFQKCLSIMRNALQGNTYLTREEIGVRLKDAYNFTKEINLVIGYILIYAELEGIICSGPKRGKQFTYALLDERVPQEKLLEREDSLAELTMRYFQSHGPANLQDFLWWSGLTSSDAKKGIALIKQKLNQVKIEETVYWFVIPQTIKKVESNIYLLPNYDEYIVGYKNRQFIFDNRHTHNLDSRANPVFQHTIMQDGKIIGTWKRELKEKSVVLSTNIFTSLDETTKEKLNQSIAQFSKYVNKPIHRESI